MDSISLSNSLSKGSVYESDSICNAYREDALSRLEDGARPEAISNEEIRGGDVILETYTVEDDAVHGGMGSVWRVHHSGWNTDLAMKRPQPRFFSEGSEARKAGFIAECENWINLGLHPNIVSCYYVREIGGVPTVFSEWMDGGSLKDAIQSGRLYRGTGLRKRLIDIAIQSARGLRYSHENGLLHQDIKPGNLLLTRGWDVKVADFGLAKGKLQLAEGAEEVGCGEAVISASAVDGSGAKAECSVRVIQMVTAVKIAETANPVVLNREGEMQLTAVITPENATNKDVMWSSSDESVVTVSEDGVVYGVNGGSAVVTCTTVDGSEKNASINVFIPTISVNVTEITVNEKEGITFPIQFYGKEGDLDIVASSSGYYFTAYRVTDEDIGEYEDGDSEEYKEGTIFVHIAPKRFGTGSVVIADKADSRNNRTIPVNITHDAVYDKTSYPMADYSSILRNPDQYEGKKVSVYGTIIQRLEGSGYFGTTYYWLLVRSGSNLFSVTVCPSALADGNVIENDVVTIYGECTGTYTYETVRGNSNTIPDIDAEHVILGAGA